MIYRSPRTTLVLPTGPLTGYVLANSQVLADRIALIDFNSEKSISYGSLSDRVQRTAGGLKQLGFGPGQTLAILAANSPDYAVAFHAAALAGGVVTTINPAYRPTEVSHQLRDAGARWLVSDIACANVAAEVASQMDIRRRWIFGSEGDLAFDRIDSSPTQQIGGQPDDTVVLPYSSGTTGLSKGVVLTHRNCAANIAQTISALPFAEHDVLIAVLPFFHCYGMQVIMNAGLRIGATIVTMARFELAAFLGAIQRYRATVAFVVPPIVLAMAKHPSVANYDLSSLRFMMSGAAPLGADVAAEAEARTGVPIFQGYGMTELSPVSHLSREGQTPPGSVGQLVANTEARLVDAATSKDAALGAEGELWLRGTLVMRGYLNNPQATRDTIDAGGWLHTGDVARVDSQGNFYIVDRLKELIKYKGFQVAPAELEALLLTHPAIADAAVIGQPDTEAGEIPKAFVVLKSGAQATPDEIMSFVAKHVATYKQLRRLEFVASIPKSASGKILRRLLRSGAAI